MSLCFRYVTLRYVTLRYVSFRSVCCFRFKSFRFVSVFVSLRSVSVLVWIMFVCAVPFLVCFSENVRPSYCPRQLFELWRRRRAGKHTQQRTLLGRSSHRRPYCPQLCGGGSRFLFLILLFSCRSFSREARKKRRSACGKKTGFRWINFWFPCVCAHVRQHPLCHRGLN